VFEVSLVQVNQDRRTVEVLWDGGQKREFKWGSIVWSWSGETGRKPTAEEIATTPPQPAPSKPTPKHVASTLSTPRYRSPATLSAPIYNAYPAALFSLQTQLFQQRRQQGQQQGPGHAHISLPPAVQQAAANANGRSWYQGMSQFRAAPQPATGGSTPSTPSTSTPASTTTQSATTPSTTITVPGIPASTVLSMSMPPTAISLTPTQIQAYQPYYQPYCQQYALYTAQAQARVRSPVAMSSSPLISRSPSTSTSATTSSTSKPTTNSVPSFTVPISSQPRVTGIGAAPYYPLSYGKLPVQPSTSTGTMSPSEAPYLKLSPQGVPSAPGAETELKAKGKDRAAEKGPRARDGIKVAATASVSAQSSGSAADAATKLPL